MPYSVVAFKSHKDAAQALKSLNHFKVSGKPIRVRQNKFENEKQEQIDDLDRSLLSILSDSTMEDYGEEDEV